MNVEFKIDYIQFSSKRMPAWAVEKNEDFRKRSNMAFYTHMTRYLNNAYMYEGNPNTDARLFVLAGKACDKLCVNSDWVKSLLNDGGNVSRLDLAMTTDTNILPLLQKSHNKIECELWQDMKIISDKDYTPQTLYIGDFSKRKDKGIFRAYDKGLQLGIDLSMFRIEQELKKKHAKIGAKRIANGETIPSVMNSKFFINEQWFKDIFGRDVSTTRFKDPTPDIVTEIDRKMAWLHKAVKPTLRYVLEYDKANGTSNFNNLMVELLKGFNQDV